MQHTGHRQRLKDKVIRYGFDSLYPHEFLEFVLFQAIPRKDTNELAHNLIEKFGSYENVFSQDFNSLISCDGVGESIALHILSYSHHHKLLKTNKMKNTSLCNIGQVRRYFEESFKHICFEEFHVALLSPSNKVICHDIFSDFSHSTVTVPMENVLKLVRTYKPKYVIYAHNHPSGNPMPSIDDILFTKQNAAKLLNGYDVSVSEHLIFANNSCYSFRHNGLLEEGIDYDKEKLDGKLEIIK